MSTEETKKYKRKPLTPEQKERKKMTESLRYRGRPYRELARLFKTWPVVYRKESP